MKTHEVTVTFSKGRAFIQCGLSNSFTSEAIGRSILYLIPSRKHVQKSSPVIRLPYSHGRGTDRLVNDTLGDRSNF